MLCLFWYCCFIKINSLFLLLWFLLFTNSICVRFYRVTWRVWKMLVDKKLLPLWAHASECRQENIVSQQVRTASLLGGHDSIELILLWLYNLTTFMLKGDFQRLLWCWFLFKFRIAPLEMRGSGLLKMTSIGQFILVEWEIIKLPTGCQYVQWSFVSEPDCRTMTTMWRLPYRFQVLDIKVQSNICSSLLGFSTTHKVFFW